MTTDWKALCAELIDALDECQRSYGNQPESFLVWKARAALAEQEVGEGPPAVTTGAWLHPAYEPGDGSADGAQMGELAWWHPQFGCDSLQMVVDNARAVLARRGNPASQPVPVPVSERLQQLEDLAADAVSGLRYIEQTHGRLYGVGWDRVYEKADRLQPAHGLPLPLPEREVEG